jgi:hypothetical protein
MRLAVAAEAAPIPQPEIVVLLLDNNVVDETDKENKR